MSTEALATERDGGEGKTQANLHGRLQHILRVDLQQG